MKCIKVSMRYAEKLKGMLVRESIIRQRLVDALANFLGGRTQLHRLQFVRHGPGFLLSRRPVFLGVDPGMSRNYSEMLPKVMRQQKMKAATAITRLAKISSFLLTRVGSAVVKKSTMMWPRIIWQKGSDIVTATADIICTSS